MPDLTRHTWIRGLFWPLSTLLPFLSIFSAVVSTHLYVSDSLKGNLSAHLSVQLKAPRVQCELGYFPLIF